MSRKKQEQELIEFAYPYYSMVIRTIIDRVYSNIPQDQDRETKMLEALWAECRDEFFDLVARADPSISSNDPQLSEKGRAALLEAIEAAEKASEALLELTDDEFISNYKTVWHADLEKRKTSNKNRLDQRDKFQFFNEPRAAARFDEYVQLQNWTSEEAAALSLDKHPNEVSSEKLAIIPSDSPFKVQYRRRLKLIERAMSAGSFKGGLNPEMFVAWAAKYSIDLPEGFAPLRSKRGQDVSGLQTNRLHKTYELVVSLAIKHYNLDITDHLKTGLPQVVKALRADVLKLGLFHDVDTLTSILAESIDWIISKKADPILAKAQSKKSAAASVKQAQSRKLGNS